MWSFKLTLKTGRGATLPPPPGAVVVTFVWEPILGRRGERRHPGISPVPTFACLLAGGLAVPGHTARADRSGFTWSAAGEGIRRPWGGYCFKEVSLFFPAQEETSLFPGQVGGP